jgi:hypothetical protein
MVTSGLREKGGEVREVGKPKTQERISIEFRFKI